MKSQEESAMTRFILVVVAITLILVMIAVIRDKNRVKEPLDLFSRGLFCFTNKTRPK